MGCWKALHACPLVGQRLKDVSSLMADGNAVLRECSQMATFIGWLRSARQSGLSDGFRVCVI